MPMVTTTLAMEITSILKEMREQTEIDDSIFANKLATAIHNFILTAEVQPGISVATAGTPTAQTGATTSIGKLL